MSALMNFLSAGDEFIASSKLYGGTFCLFDELRRFGINARDVNSMTLEEIEPIINRKISAIFGEVLSNSGLEIIDVKIS